MAYVIGIDQSVLHTGVAVFDTVKEEARLTLIEPSPKLSSLERLVYLHNNLNKALDGIYSKLSILEGYSIGSHNRPFDLGEVGGIVKLVLHMHSDRVLVVAPKQLKKFITGKGTASKEEMQKAIGSIYGPTIADDNLADAYGLSQVAHCLVDETKIRRRVQHDIILELQKADPSTKRKTKAVKQSRYSL